MTIPKILAIQFRFNPVAIEQEQECFTREIGTDTEVDFVSALDQAIDWQYPEVILEGYGGVILGGSSDLDFDGGRPVDDPARQLSYEVLGRLRPLFSYLFENDVPTLGICYGHQILGAFAGAQVHSDPAQKKVASHQVKLLVDKNEYFLFSDLPDVFHGHYRHNDVLDRVPEGSVLVMQGGEQCQVSALKYKNNIFSTQFHPELTYNDMVNRALSTPGYIPEGAAVEEIFKDDPSSNTIIRNFGRFVATLGERSNSQVLLSVE